MTPDRERTLEEALLRCFSTNAHGATLVVEFENSADAYAAQEYIGLRKDAALASPAQEPAPSAEAEEIARHLLAWVNVLQSEYNSVACINEIAINGGSLIDELESAAAALRRYAGDGGVTDEMVAAARAALHDYNPCRFHNSAANSIRFGNDIRRALEATARATSSEKGGAR